MKWFKNTDRDKLLYGGFIITFIVLYAATAFVSWYHAITFFNIANAVWLSVLLSFVAEVGQASVLFSILLSDNKHRFLSWAVMIILTTLQVIGNVVSSYDWIVKHGAAGVEAFQKSILFWMTVADPEIFKVIIAWISGALLPIIALSMTALVAQNIELRAKKAKTALDSEPPAEPIDAKDIISEVSRVRPTQEDLDALAELLNKKSPIEKAPSEEELPKESPTEEKKSFEFLFGRTKEEMKQYQEEKEKEYQKWLNETSKKENEEIPPPDQLTDEEVEDLLASKDDEDSFEYPEEEIVEELVSSPDVVIDPIISISNKNGLVDGIIQVSGPVPAADSKTKDKSEEERLERIRKIAREQEELKKK